MMTSSLLLQLCTLVIGHSHQEEQIYNSYEILYMQKLITHNVVFGS